MVVSRYAALKRFAQITAGISILVGLLVLLGWALNLSPLKEIAPGLVSMKSTTALGFLLAGVSLWLSSREPVEGRNRRIARSCAAMVTMVGLLTCTEYLFSWNLGIDQLLFKDPGTGLIVGPPGRMSPITALNFLLLGTALFLIDLRRARWMVDALTCAAVLFSAMVLAGYLYGVPVLYAVWTYIAVALHTAVVFALLCAGILCARPDRGLMRVITSDTAGGIMARRLIPAALVVPPMLGWFRLWGERAGLYGTSFGLAIFAISNVVVFVTLILWNARTLFGMDADRKGALEALRTNEEHLRLVVDHSPAGIAMLDRDMMYLVASPRWMKDYGLGDRSVVGRSHYEVFPEISDQWKEIHRRCLAGAVERNEEDSFPRADGTLDWVRWEIRPWHDRRAKIGGIIIFSELITERKRAEERFQATFEQAAVGIAHVAPDGRWLLVNQRLCDILGYTKEELLAKTLQDLTHPDDLQTALDHIRQILEGTIQTYSLEKRFFKKDQSIVWISLTRSLVRIPSGTPDYFITVIEDISRRKKAEEALKATEARLSSLSDANLIGILVADLQGQILDANAAFLKMIGYSKEEMASGKVPWAEMTPPEYRPFREQALSQLKATGVATPWEREYIRKDGSRVFALVGGSMIKGSADTCVAFVLDLSERKRLEEQLRQSQRMEVVGRLAGGVAHDFNNLLTPIMGYSEIILSRLAENDPLREDLEEIRRSGARAAALTRQLLAFSRKQVLQPKVLDLNGLISDAAKLLRRLIGEDVTLHLSLEPASGRVKVDPGQLEQVLMNLAVNARDAMPRGGRLTIETANVQLDQGYASKHADVIPGPYVLVAVSDTGTGMDKETMSRLFEPFFTTKEKGKGTGLGLATVHGIIKQSKGHIWVYSEPGRGTTFKVYLPEEMDEISVEAATPSVQTTDRGTETILLVEDEEGLRGFAAKLLRLKGYTVLEARNGESALLISKNHAGAIDLVLTDVVMPGISGREVAKQLLASRPRMRVIYMSGYTENAIVHHGVLDAGTNLLEKPFTPDSLARKIRAVLESPQGGSIAG
jgi:PAS domain S-box-containing protein